MNQTLNAYFNGLNSDVIELVKQLNNDIPTEKDNEKRLKMEMLRLQEGMMMNAFLTGRPLRSYVPY